MGFDKREELFLGRVIAIGDAEILRQPGDGEAVAQRIIDIFGPGGRQLVEAGQHVTVQPVADDGGAFAAVNAVGN